MAGRVVQRHSRGTLSSVVEEHWTEVDGGFSLMPTREVFGKGRGVPEHFGCW